MGAAERAFKNALDVSPGHPEASYGYGYALMQRGAREEAKSQLCVAQRGGLSVDLMREVNGLLEANGFTCP
jgi:hypothetical protein